MRTVAALPAAALLAGAAAGLLAPSVPHLISIAALCAGVAASAFGWWCASTRAVAAGVVLAFAAGGSLLAADAWDRAWRPPLRSAFERLARDQRAQAEAEGRRLPLDDEAFAVVEGTLRADASRGPNGVSLSIAVDVARGIGRAAGGIAVTVVGSLAPERIGDWRAGRRVRVPVQLHRPARYLDPGVPDFERGLARRGTTLVGTVKSGALVELLAKGSFVDEWLGAARAFSRRAITGAVGRWDPQSAAIVAAIVIGDRAGLDEEVQRRLQEAGTYHVLAISGGNIAILAGLLIGGFRVAGWLGRSAMLAAIPLLGTYALFVGGGASVDRATLMATVYFAARAMDHRGSPVNTLAVVAAVMVAGDPLLVEDPAFVLTFGATLAILESVTKDTKGTKDTKEGSAARLWGAVRRMFIASVAAEVMLFPVSAFVFSRITFAGLALNFLAIPLMGVAQLAGMCVVPLAAVSTTVAAAAGWIAHVGAAGLVWSARLVRFVPAATYRIAAPAVTMVIIYYCALAAAWLGRDGRRRMVHRASTCAAVVSGVWILVNPPAIIAASGDGRLRVTFIDVGQGDAALVRFPRGASMLVDAGGLAGGGFDIGDRVVAPVLREAGVRRLDVVALTHGDPDHVGGAAAIVEEFRPREVWEAIPVPRSAPLTALRIQAQSLGARWANVYTGARVAIDGVDVFARHPAPADWERQKVRNDDSLVLELRWRDVSIVFTGDIGRPVESQVAAAVPPARLRVVKVPHHGSLTSSSQTFVEALHPTIAVVSAGRSNHFGHPAPEVIDRYDAIRSDLFRTDRDGAIRIDTDGHTLHVSTFTGRLPRTATGSNATKTRKHETS